MYTHASNPLPPVVLVGKFIARICCSPVGLPAIIIRQMCLVGRLAPASLVLMKSFAIEQYKERLETAREAFERFDAATSAKEMRRHWSDFIQSLNPIYSKLEQGAKEHTKAAPWFGSKKRERREDELVAYLMHARNAEEHGLEISSGYIPWSASWTVGDVEANDVEASCVLGGPLPLQITGPIKTGSMEVRRNYAGLLPITDRSTRYPPPANHLGKRLHDYAGCDYDARSVGRLALAYMQTLIAEAEQFFAT